MQKVMVQVPPWAASFSLEKKELFSRVHVVGLLVVDFSCVFVRLIHAQKVKSQILSCTFNGNPE